MTTKDPAQRLMDIDALLLRLQYSLMILGWESSWVKRENDRERRRLMPWLYSTGTYNEPAWYEAARRICARYGF